jgi:hypothetical protein
MSVIECEAAEVVAAPVSVSYVKCEVPVWKAASTDKTRPALRGVSFASRDGVTYCVGTNSYMLAAVPVEGMPAEWCGAIVPLEAAKLWQKPGKRNTPAPVLTIDRAANTCTVITDDGATSFALVDRAAPKVMELVPGEYLTDSFDTSPVLGEFGVNPCLMVSVMQALGGKLGVRVRSIGATRPLFVQARSGRDTYLPGFALVMPIKVD